MKDVTLGKLAVAKLLFNSLTIYDDSLDRLRKSTIGNIDLTNQNNRSYLLKWLNEWRCRNLSKDHHAVALTSIMDFISETLPQ